MNVFLHELKSYRKNLIIWSACIVLLLVASMAKFTALSSGGPDAAKLLEQFPATVQAIFGMSGLDITTVVGYFGILYLYIAILLAIHAGLLGADIVAKEEQDKTTEFLYIKPLSRSRVLTAKLLAALSLIITLNLITFAASFLLAKQYGGTVSTLREIALFQAAYFILQLLFMAIGMAVAASRWSRHASKVIAATVFVSYLLYIVATMQPAIRTVCGVSPLVHFEAATIITTKSLSFTWLVVYGVVAISCVVLGYQLLRRRDLRV